MCVNYCLFSVQVYYMVTDIRFKYWKLQTRYIRLKIALVVCLFIQNEFTMQLSRNTSNYLARRYLTP